MPTNDSRTLTRLTKTAVVHKVIDITPPPASNSKQVPVLEGLEFAKKHRAAAISLAGLLFGGIVLAMLLSHGGKHVASTANPAKAAPFVVRVAPAATQNVAQAAQRKPAVPQPPIIVELNLPTATQQGLLECQWRGNGKDWLVMDARNVSDHPLRLHLGSGQLLASDESTVVVLKSQTLDFAPRSERHEQFATVASSAGNKVVGAEYHLSAGTLPDLDKLFSYITAHPATAGAVQTATLILTENLPLSAFAKFNELSAGPETFQESQDFKADTVDILSALAIIKDLGINRPLAVTIDPQLEVEAMIDPGAHGLAVSYYGITDEWTFWKNQLLEGDPSTRHYALYGIARYYPNIALQMLPKWARQESVSPVYRLSAVEALAQTGKPEAIPVLRELEREFGGTSDLGRAAHQAANYLDEEFATANGVTAGLSSTAQPHRQSVLASAGN